MIRKATPLEILKEHFNYDEIIRMVREVKHLDNGMALTNPSLLLKFRVVLESSGYSLPGHLAINVIKDYCMEYLLKKESKDFPECITGDPNRYPTGANS